MSVWATLSTISWPRLPSSPTAWAIAIVAGAFGFYLGVKVTRRQLFLRQLRIARISPEELEGKLTAREPVFIVDLRHELDVQADPMMIRGAVHLAPAALEESHAVIPRDREVGTLLLLTERSDERPGGASVTEAGRFADPAPGRRVSGLARAWFPRGTPNEPTVTCACTVTHIPFSNF